MAKERSIVVRLKAEVDDFNRQMGAAGRTLSDFERAQQQMGGAATTTMGRMVQSARANEREWSEVGRTLLTAGAAVTAMGGAALKVGIDYNAMRQKATQAMTAVTGSTEVAAVQMRKLDEYGKDSWLMRDSLVRAQTQMSGFGIETSKVIPYMDALAEAVAATGGSNQDFEELARVMGKVQSQGKITAQELNEFGSRGVDAAQLIGDAMGMTAEQIRDEITAGSLDAEDALDALAEGMKTRFEGASDLVRNTFGGAMDNAKAAFRDLAAAIAEPLVDPEGGGALVDWVNNVADSLFRLRDTVQEMPGWMRGGTLAIGGLTTAATLSAGAFMLALPAYVRFQDSLQTLAAIHPSIGKAGTAMGKLGKAAGRAVVGIAAANVALATLSSLMVDTPAQLEEMAVALSDGDFDRGFAHLADGYNTFGEALRTLTSEGLFDKFDRFGQSLIGLLPGVTTAVQGSTEQFEIWGTILADMAKSGDMDDVASQFNQMASEAAEMDVSVEELLDLMPAFRDHLIGVADAAGLATDDTTLAAIATGELAVESEEASGAVDEFGNSVDDATGSVQAHIDSLNEQYDALMDSANAALAASDAEIGYYTALDTATDKIKENGAELDLNTEKGRENRTALNRLADAGLNHVDKMRQQDATSAELRAEMGRIRDDFIKNAQKAGYNADEAARLADNLGLIPGDYRASVSVDTAVAMSRVSALQSALNGVRGTAGSIGHIPGLGHVNRGQLFHGGIVKANPGLSAGGMVPGPRAGRDNILWPLHSGGMTLQQPLEGGEFVVRSSQAARYAPQLEAMNSGTYPPAGGSVVVSSLSSADVERIAVAVERGAASGSARGAAVGVGGSAVGLALASRQGDF